MLKKSIFHIIFALLIFPVSLLWGEAFTQFMFPQPVHPEARIWREDPVAGYIMLSHAEYVEQSHEYNVSFTTNSMGLRDHEYGQKKNDQYRVLLLGDSFSIGHGLELQHSLPKQIEECLSGELKAHDKDAEVINCAMAGYSAYNYLYAWRKWSTILKPDFVLVGFLLTDDWKTPPPLPERKYIVEEGKVVGSVAQGEALKKRKKGFFGKMKGIRFWLSEHSHLYVLLRNNIYWNEALLEKISGKKKANKNVLSPFLIHQDPGVAESWNNVSEILRTLKEETERAGVGLAVIAIPSKIEIDTDFFQDTAASLGVDEELLDKDLPHQHLEAVTKSLDIPFFSPVDKIRAEHEIEACYFKFDSHWNKYGVRNAAQEIVRQWLEHASSPCS